MPRKVTKALVRDVPPDRLYSSVQVQRLINRVMRDGKKQLAERLVYDGMQKAATKLKVENPLEVFEQALKNVQPHLETRSRRVGGANYQIPFEVKGQRQNHLTTMWFVAAARARKGMSMADRIALELVDAYNSQGSAVKKKEDTHKMAEANRAFAHYPDGASGDEFLDFEVTILTLPSESDPTDERFDILPDVVNDPLATTTVQVTGPMRLGLEDDGIVVWPLPDSDVVRSEERRVGKECRSRWSPYH